ncbi:MAG: DUF4954 family protein [Bacteroidales bacterium]
MAQQRTLTPSEIKQLEIQGCSSADWSLVVVSENFHINHIQNSRFSGKISIGEFGATLYESGIYNSKLHTCTIGNLCLIDNALISNYIVGEKSIIRNIGELSVTCKSSFGNGTEVAVLNETGGREVKIFDQLSAQNAYFQAFYRHRPILIARFKEMIQRYAESVSSEIGTVGTNCEISNCRTLKNIRVCDFGIINGASRLENGTINSSADAPTHIGEDVMAENFIISSASKVESGTILKNVFVGQGVHLASRFTASESLFFSYCQGENGEACAIFAGPFTVTHHKSTLLIGGYYSYLNGGSGTNQSNHHYRLGPLHHGIMERGCKTASDSYLLWPSRIGAFSLVSGRHKIHVDTSNLPFSYLVENQGETYLVPAATLRNIGTTRDAQKWVKRDTLQIEKRLDNINSTTFSPYTVQKIEQAIHLLQELQNEQGFGVEIYKYKGVLIKNSSLRKGILIYENVLIKYLGDKLLPQIIENKNQHFLSIIVSLIPVNNEGIDTWIDVSGLIAPKRKIDELCEQIESQILNSISDVEDEFNAINANFVPDEWAWIVNRVEERIGTKVSLWTAEDIHLFTLDYQKAIESIYQNLADDARKEFANDISISSGIDGDESIRSADFNAVCGLYEEHPVVQNLQNELLERRKWVEVTFEFISHLKN